jgi:GNAT superfamily N-acetyltransferase
MSLPAAAGRAAAGVSIEPVRSRSQLDRFIRCAWDIYAGDPVWVPPLIMDLKGVLSPKHPFHRHADVELFTANRGARVVGRVAAIHNRAHTEFSEEPAGFFGLFECVDDLDVARALLSTAEDWLRERGLEIVRGPMNLSTNDELWSPGVLIDGFDTPPAVMMGHTPPYYARLIEACGYGKSKDLLAYWIDRSRLTRLERSANRLLSRSGVRMRPLNKRRLKEEVDIIQDIYNEAWEHNWGFVPMSAEEIQHLAKQLGPVVNPNLCAIAFIGEEPVAFALALPDFNQALKHVNGRLLPFGILKLLWYKRRIDAARTLTLGVKREHRHKGLDALLILHLFREGAREGFLHGECSWILEDNTSMRHGLERLGARVYKTYRVFEKKLAD